MKITLIAAVSENNIIGINGRLPWDIPEDRKRFRELTLEHPVIMGRKTYDSIPKEFRPLPKRKNIVMSNSLNPTEGIYLARNIE
ncbi:MAG: dihydrofolate reductase, partial [Nanoarchaeota archaeon]